MKCDLLADDPARPGETVAASSGPVEPEFIRLPKPGTSCLFSGLSRSSLNEIILPGPHNSFKPPVRSIPLRKRGAQRGIRLIVWSSLKAYLYAQEATGNKVPETNP